MKRSLSARTLITILAFAIAGLAGAANHQVSMAQPAEVKISYSLAAPKITLHEPVMIVFQVTNNLDEPVNLDLGQDRKAGFEFSLTKPDGVKMQLPILTHEGLALGGAFPLRPGESYIQSLILNEWYDFASEGRYELEGHLVNPVVINSGARYNGGAGFRATLEIGPRDELALAKTCDTLTNQIEASDSYQQSSEATLALSYVKDPIAVPYLRRALLSKKLVEPLAIKGLEQIANEAAVRVLIESLKVEYADTAVLSRSALARIRNQTHDPELRQEIDHALT